MDDDAERHEVPEFTDTHVEHLIPNQAIKSRARPFMMKTTAKLSHAYMPEKAYSA